MNARASQNLQSEVPNLDIQSLSDDDKQHGAIALSQLRNLAAGVRSFAAALDIFQGCAKEMEVITQDAKRAVIDRGDLASLDGEGFRRRVAERSAKRESQTQTMGSLVERQLIAGREGGMTLWQMHTALNAIKASLASSKELRDLISVEKVQAASQRLRNLSPDLKALRDGIAHRFEHGKTPDQLKDNSTKPFEEGGMKNESNSGLVTDNFSGNTYMTTAYSTQDEKKGSIAKYDLSSNTLDELVALSRDVFGSVSSRKA